ncbi:integral membrane regulator [Streptomyces fumigatiscleroticus]|nr:integral membrane regulator [Streptomyces fumigatiscleroticus]
MTAPIPRDIPDLPAIPATPVVQPSPVPATAVVAPVRRPLAAAFRLLTALAAVVGVSLELALGGPARVLSYFTIQSSLLLALVLLLSARRAWTARHPLPSALTGAALLYVVITGLVYHLLLAGAAAPFSMTDGTAGPSVLLTVADQLLHTVIPVTAVLDWLLLSGSGRLHLRHATTWMLYPLTYLAFTLLRGALPLPGAQPRYLYPFLDVARHGYKGVLGNALLLGLACYALAVFVVVLDHVRPNPMRHPRKTGFRL